MEKTIYPERKYNVSHAARLLGLHRCTIYKLMKRNPAQITAEKSEDGARQLIKGSVLLAFRNTYKVKYGRKLKTTRTNV
jgi:hypothetical protein